MSEVFQKGATSKSIYIIVRDPATMQGLTGLTNATAGLKVYYTRDLAAATAITLAAQTPTGAYTSGGFCAVDGTNQPGLYRLDLPNAALATGVNTVRVTWSGGGTLTDGVEVALTDYDPTTVDKTGFSLSGAGNQAIWDTLTSASTVAGSVGKKLADWVLGSDKKAILSADAHTGAVVPTVTTVGTVTTVSDKTGYALSAAGMDPVLDAANGIETGLTLRGFFRLLGAALAGKLTVSGSTYTFKNAVADSKARITATVDATGRTAVTTDQT